MNNGLGSRGTRTAAATDLNTASRRFHFPSSPLSRIPSPRERAVPYVTEKVGYAVGLHPVEIGPDPDVQEVVAGLLGAQKMPNEKYSEPVTSAQEVGWLYQPLVAPNPRFVHGLTQGEATKFAETYTKKMAGEHMFHGKSGKYLRF